MCHQKTRLKCFITHQRVRQHLLMEMGIKHLILTSPLPIFVQDFKAPTFLSENTATKVSAAGTSIDLKFSENLASVANNQAEFDQFTIKKRRQNDVRDIAIGDVLTLTVTNKIGSADVVTVICTGIRQ